MRFRTPGCKQCWLAGAVKKWDSVHPSCDNPDPNHGGTWKEVSSLTGMGREAKPTTPPIKGGLYASFHAALLKSQKMGGQ